MDATSDWWTAAWQCPTRPFCNEPRTDIGTCTFAPAATGSTLECYWSHTIGGARVGTPALFLRGPIPPAPIEFALQMRDTMAVQAECTVWNNDSALATYTRKVQVRNCDEIASYEVYHPLHQGAFVHGTCAASRAPHQACRGHIVYFDGNRSVYVNATGDPLTCCNHQGMLPPFECTARQNASWATCEPGTTATYGLYDVHILQVIADLAYTFPQSAIGLGGLLLVLLGLSTIVWAVQSVRLVLTTSDDGYTELIDVVSHRHVN
ncbi:hypothetical protein ACHHYP_03811 [Achlya hypogyna]|uniref:Uncharacterized protein n=1 Tax=Achlya hypogyna TaxID=1202772 RepID=A0A1V9Z2S3_ACHHY|nr:hypothetical protein ACHHYP_03811 [Achlya hypogyna]